MTNRSSSSRATCAGISTACRCARAPTPSVTARASSCGEPGAGAAGVLLALALIVGTAATAYQAQQAAPTGPRGAPFADVRKLANALLFDYHDAIRDLRGARPVRERMVRDALGYLDGLPKESREDPTLQRELAGSYHRIGDLQGGEPSSLGDTDGAARSYGKALEILETLLRADSTNRTPPRRSKILDVARPSRLGTG